MYKMKPFMEIFGIKVVFQLQQYEKLQQQQKQNNMSKNFLKVDSGNIQTGSPTTRSVDFSRMAFRGQPLATAESMNELKQKAHKSFMQVIQMEALHQEEMEMVMKQNEQDIQQYKDRQQLLLRRVKLLENELKNNCRNNFEPVNISFNLGDVEDIQYKEESNCIDDSSILNLREMLTHKEASEKLRYFQAQLKKQGKLFSEGGPQSKSLIDKLFIVFQQINSQNCNMKEQNEQMSKKFARIESQFKTLRIQNQSTQKQAKFLSQHIKRVHNDKLALEKKIQQLESVNKLLDARNHQKSQNQTVNSPALIVNNHQPRARKNSNITLQSELNISGDTQGSFKGAVSAKLSRMSSQTGIGYQTITQPSSPNTLVSLKNFRKKQNYRFANI